MMPNWLIFVLAVIGGYVVAITVLLILVYLIGAVLEHRRTFRVIKRWLKENNYTLEEFRMEVERKENDR